MENIEKSLIGTFLLNNKKFLETESLLKPAHFFERTNQEIYRQIHKQYQSKERIDLNILAEDVSKKCHITLDDLHELMNNSVSGSFYENIERLDDRYKKYQLTMLIDQAKMSINEKDLSETIGKLDNGINEILSNLDNKSTGHIKEASLDALETIATAKETQGLTGIDTGFSDQNFHTGGFQLTDLVILGARPGMGKTTLSINWMLHAAKQFPVVMYTLEMSPQQVFYTIISIESGISVEDMRKGNVTDQEMQKIYQITNEINQLPIFVIEKFKIDDIIASMRFMKRKYGIQMVFIDYLQLIDPGDVRLSRTEQVSVMTRKLKLASKQSDCNVCTICLSQLSRALEQRSDKRPMLSDLRDSGAIEQDADQIYFVYRDNYYNHESQDQYTELILAKNRHGETGRWKRSFNNRKFTVYDELTEPDDSPFDIF